jgi:DNA-binding NtrC family response regulator
VTYKEAREEFERDYWSKLLALHNENITEVAKAAQVQRSNVYRRLTRMGVPLRRPLHRGNWGDLTD